MKMFGSIIQGIAGIQDSNINIWNAYQSWKNTQYQKDLQNRIFRREDNSQQRAVKDLLAAGLSPTLAAGSGSGAGQAINVSAPHAESNLSDIAPAIMSLMKMKEDISNTVAQRELIDQQRRKTSAEADIARHDFSIYKKTGTTSNAGSLLNSIRNIPGALESPILKPVVDGLKDKLNNPFGLPNEPIYNKQQMDDFYKQYPWLDKTKK